MIYNRTEACDMVWGPHNYTLLIIQGAFSGKFLSACGGWRLVSDV